MIKGSVLFERFCLDRYHKLTVNNDKNYISFINYLYLTIIAFIVIAITIVIVKIFKKLFKIKSKSNRKSNRNVIDYNNREPFYKVIDKSNWNRGCD